jgi:hypothetical protein
LVGPQSHRAAGADLVDGKPLGVVDPDQIEPPGLVRGEGKTDLIGVEPARHAARTGDVRRRQLR